MFAQPRQLFVEHPHCLWLRQLRRSRRRTTETSSARTKEEEEFVQGGGRSLPLLSVAIVVANGWLEGRGVAGRQTLLVSVRTARGCGRGMLLLLFRLLLLLGFLRGRRCLSRALLAERMLQHEKDRSCLSLSLFPLFFLFWHSQGRAGTREAAEAPAKEEEVHLFFLVKKEEEEEEYRRRCVEEEEEKEQEEQEEKEKEKKKIDEMTSSGIELRIGNKYRVGAKDRKRIVRGYLFR